MPRDGSGVYSMPVGTLGVTDTTIESTKYNNFVSDVEHDLNQPRPIIAGGTGATNPRDAMIALGGELASQLVTNYDLFPFLPGSFYSASGATGAPQPTGIFMGIAYWLDTGNMVLVATGLASGNAAPATTVPPVTYIRERVGSVWGNWLQSDTRAINLGNLKVDRAGDTMTGPLMIQMANPTLSLSRTSSARASIVGGVGASARWEIIPGSGDPETGSNAGSVFAISRYSDAGIFISNSILIDRATNTFTAVGPSSLNGPVTAGATLAVTGVATFNGAVNVTGMVTNFNGKYVASNVTSPGYIAWNGTVGWGMFNTGGLLSWGHADNAGNITDSLMSLNVAGTLSLAGGLSVAVNTTIAGTLTVTGTAGFTSATFAGQVNIPATGALTTTEPNGTVISQAGLARTLFSSGTTGEPFVSFFKQGGFAANFGLASDANFYYGGSSFSPTTFKFWTTREVASIVNSVRTILQGDVPLLVNAVMAEPGSGVSMVTGSTGVNSSNGITFRYRILQIQAPGGGWVAITTTV